MSDETTTVAETDENGERDFTSYAGKEPTSLQARMADWLLDKVGVMPADEESFRDGVRLAVALRMDFQRSAENREATEREKTERQSSLTERREKWLATKAEREAKAKEREERKALREATKEEREKAKAERAAKAEARKAEQLAKAEARLAKLRGETADGDAAEKPKRTRKSKADKAATEETPVETADGGTTVAEDEAPW